MRRRQVWMAAVGAVLLAIVPATTSLSQTGTSFEDVGNDTDETVSEVEENTSSAQDTSTPSVGADAEVSQAMPSILFYGNDWRTDARAELSVDPDWAPQEMPVDASVEAGYEGMIPLSFLSSRDALYCVDKDHCKTEEDLSYTYVDVSQTMKNLEEEGTNTYFSVDTNGPDLTTYWMVCTFDKNGKFLDCHRDDNTAGFGYRIDIDDSAREVALFPLMSAYNDYQIKMWSY